MPARRYNVLTTTDHGTMIVNRFDPAVSFNLSIHGSWDIVAVRILVELSKAIHRARKRDIVAVDVGANLGALTVPLARSLEGFGVVHAFEPQRLIYYMLCGNVALASLENVYCYQSAVSDQPGRIEMPQYRLDRIVNIGAYQLEKTVDTDFDGVDENRVEAANVVTLDSFPFPHLDILKIDVEGMELKVLQGAVKLVEKHQPVVLCEILKGDQQPLKEFFWNRNYRLFDYGDNKLAVPREKFHFRSEVKEILPE